MPGFNGPPQCSKCGDWHFSDERSLQFCAAKVREKELRLTNLLDSLPVAASVVKGIDDGLAASGCNPVEWEVFFFFEDLNWAVPPTTPIKAAMTAASVTHSSLSKRQMLKGKFRNIVLKGDFKNTFAYKKLEFNVHAGTVMVAVLSPKFEEAISNFRIDDPEFFTKVVQLLVKNEYAL